jgi:hypothetical protein
VTAPITMHGKWEDNYDDPSHPIPSVTALDVHAIKHGGGSALVIIVASPLQSDERSQRRLLDKIEIYLKFLQTPEYQSVSGLATPENTTIVVRLHPDSSPAIYELLERCEPWVAQGQATLVVTPLEPS